MTEAIFTWAVIIGIVGYLIYQKKKRGNRRDYSLGLKAAQEIRQSVRNKDYTKAENQFSTQDLNDTSQIVDHLALSMKEEELKAWGVSENSDISALCLGVFYLHMAWIERSHKLAKNVSGESADAFSHYLTLCERTFDEISVDSQWKPELESRLIRLYMSTGDMDLAMESFHRVNQQHPDFIWPYLHYAELIQPKWGGTIENVMAFYDSLPDDFLIHSLVELKLINDAIVIEENYFSKYTHDITDFASQKTDEIDNALNSIRLQSIHKYILYNYLEALTFQTGNERLRKKYTKLKGDHETIYPYGLMK